MISMRIPPSQRARRLRDDDIIIEFISLGQVVRVSAIDQTTGTEVSMVGDPKVGKNILSRLAARKLRYVLARRKKHPMM